MVTLRKAGSYSKKHARPNTRISKKKSKSYIKTVPQIKVVKFNIGRKDKYDKGEFDTEVKIISEEKVQIRDNAIESARQYITRELEKQLPGNYYFEVRVFPHHIIRENKMITGVKADRMQSGMKHSFGKPIGRAALVNYGKDIFLIGVSGEKNAKLAREILHSIRAKLPCKSKILIEKYIKA
ncbi:MAG: 50S ribosomal protein L16 [Candidatus Pacearchaeota archaeon]